MLVMLFHFKTAARRNRLIRNMCVSENLKHTFFLVKLNFMQIALLLSVTENRDF
jgi:hypothetical protein